MDSAFAKFGALLWIRGTKRGRSLTTPCNQKRGIGDTVQPPSGESHGFLAQSLYKLGGP